MNSELFIARFFNKIPFQSGVYMQKVVNLVNPVNQPLQISVLLTVALFCIVNQL
jgi:hypothetical protein